MKQMLLIGQGNEHYGSFPIINEGTSDSCLLMPDGATIPVHYSPVSRKHYHFREWAELGKHLPFDCFREANRYARFKDRAFVGEQYGYMAYCNAFDCIVYGWGRQMWDSLAIPNADEVWDVAERAAKRFLETL